MGKLEEMERRIRELEDDKRGRDCRRRGSDKSPCDKCPYRCCPWRRYDYWYPWYPTQPIDPPYITWGDSTTNVTWQSTDNTTGTAGDTFTLQWVMTSD